ncbi:putative galacturonosyltransferase 14 [Sarracenia purpurea var. burkii]
MGEGGKFQVLSVSVKTCRYICLPFIFLFGSSFRTEKFISRIRMAYFLSAPNLKSNLTMWKLGTLPTALIAFKGHVQVIDPSWHMLGLGYQNKTNIESVKKATVIHYNGQSKPWLQIGFAHLRPFWTKYVNYSNDFIRNCHILE